MSEVDRRYQVFISSTFTDLKEERKQAIEVVFEQGHIPIALERFHPSNESDLELIKRVIADCQVYLLILGHRYGEMPPDKNISYTELEFDIAAENKLLILALILEEPEIKERRERLDPTITKDHTEMYNLERLEKFHKKVRTMCHHRKWSPRDQFKYLVEQALNRNLRNYTKPGFVREPEDPLKKVMVAASANPFVVDIVNQLQSFERLYERCYVKPKEKQVLSQFFWETYADAIRTHRVNLFFESGSTIAYVAREGAAALSKSVEIDDQDKPTIHISTNNILAYLELWLSARVPCAAFPWGPPGGERYGASYGPIERLQRRSPTYDLSPLPSEAKEAIDLLNKTQWSLTAAVKSPALLLGAISGLQVGGPPNAVFPEGMDENARIRLTQALGRCSGPHVGSYHNKVFKRFMYQTRLPLMIFVTGDKINCPVEMTKCHFILDSELPWEQFSREYPLSFCVGCSISDREVLTGLFEELGFSIVSNEDCKTYTAFVARNQRFIEEFEKPVGLCLCDSRHVSALR